ncbi:hypothetical protein [Psychrobacter phenylpyruvicus]|uniref:Uncharacterized protein n=1 Tax=Psychrobacter phenylpyruvicus TaxID=29432 RepID=A0A379LI32_9GAMM|nr:hypothetical protein [Psychrobacter phenylpyruvicus]SUD90259.1 Uncharacterised protein [Psychrobacter phenylpyruvicus]
MKNLTGGNLYLGEGDQLTGGIAAFDPEEGPFTQTGPFEDANLQGTNIYYSNADDTLTLSGINGGSIDMGAGNDTIVITGSNQTIDASGTGNINGGEGIDTLQFTGTGNKIWANELFSTEIIDLGGKGNTFHTGDLLQYNPSNLDGGNKGLYIAGGAGDTVNLEGTATNKWYNATGTNGTPVEYEGNSYYEYYTEALGGRTIYIDTDIVNVVIA